jgi:hypothetical protein
LQYILERGEEEKERQGEGRERKKGKIIKERGVKTTNEDRGGKERKIDRGVNE